MKSKILLAFTLILALSIGSANANPMKVGNSNTTKEQMQQNQVHKYHHGKKHHRHHRKHRIIKH